MQTYFTSLYIRKETRDSKLSHKAIEYRAVPKIPVPLQIQIIAEVRADR